MKQWLPAVAGMACLGLGPGLIGVYGFFTEYLADEFDVGVATINIGPVALLLVPGIAAPFIGRLVDRMDIRRIILCGSALAMVSLLAASQAPSLWMAGLAFLCFSAGLALYGPVVVNGLLVKLYEGREARALAIAAIGISFSSAILPPVVASLLAAMDWRSALASLASFVLIALWLAVLAAIPPGVHASVAARPHRDGAGGAFYRDRNFWLIGLCMALWMNVAMVLAICYPPHFIAQGLSMEQAGWLISLAGASGLIGKALLAMIADSLRRHARGRHRPGDRCADAPVPAAGFDRAAPGGFSVRSQWRLSDRTARPRPGSCTGDIVCHGAAGAPGVMRFACLPKAAGSTAVLTGRCRIECTLTRCQWP